MNESLLGHIRIIDFSTSVAASLASQLLAEVGADVIKVEPPGGDPRRAEPGFAVWNRSKRSVTLDLNDADQRRQFDALLASADLLIHDLPPSQSRALHLDDDALRQRFAQLIAVTVTGMPLGHSQEELPCADSLVLAHAGFFDAVVPAQRASGPTYLRFALGTHCAAYLAATGALARLRVRQQGLGAGPVHTSLLQGGMVPLLMLCQRAERHSPAFDPPPKDFLNPLVECKDGVWLHIMSPADHVPSVAAAMDRLDPVFRAQEKATLPPYMLHLPSFMLYRHIFKERSSREWLDELWANDVAVDAAVPLGQLYFDEQARVNGYVLEVDDPTWGKTLQPGSPLAVTPPPRVKWPTPLAGAHTAEVLATLSTAPTPKVSAALAQGQPAQPLAGLKVLDLGNFLAGPLATELLAELGATVIKLEATSGDPMRWVEWAFCGAQRGKRDIAVDLKNPAARPIIERLVRWADIVHHNLRMPAAEKLGLGYEALRAINPKIIYSHVNAYGPKGPRQNWPGFDQMMQTAAGWEVESAGEGNAPGWVRFGMTDHICALSSMLATVLAVHERDRTGEGQFVSSSLLGATALTQGETMARPDGSILPYARLDKQQTGVSPQQRMYQCADGWLSLLAQRPGSYAQLLQAAGATSVTDLECHFNLSSVDAGLALCRQCHVDAVRVKTDVDGRFLDDLEFKRLGLVAGYEHPVYGHLELLGRYWDFPGMQAKLDLPPPTLGQHTSAILRELGFTEGEISAMKGSGLVAETLGMGLNMGSPAN